MKSKVLNVLILIAISISLNAQKTAFEMADLMTRGINLGNTFDATGFEGNWAPAAKEYYFDAYKEAGFTCVRIPITWNSYLSNEDSTHRLGAKKPFKVEKQFQKRINEVINWSLSRGFITIINIHHDSWLKSQETFDERKDRFYALWEQLSKQYKDYPEELLFEIINEPHHEKDGKDNGLTQEQLDGLNKEALAIIRKNNPTRVCIFTGRGWSSLNDLEKTVVPDPNDKYLMGTYHSYSPWPFAGEGKRAWGSKEDYASMDDEFKKATAYSKKYNVPVFIGEFGAMHQCDYNSRMKHYAHYVENIQKYNLPSAAWDDGGYLFKVYERKSKTWDDAKDILASYCPKSIKDFQLKNIDKGIQLNWQSRSEKVQKVIIERKSSRAENFKKIDEIKNGDKYTDTSKKDIQSYYYYRIVEVLEDGSKLYSYPQVIYRS